MSASPSEPLVDFENRTAPVLLEMIQPDYPEEAGNAHGDVTVLLQISEAGFVVGIKVISGPEVFYEPARTASKKLKFEPALKNNEPVASSLQVFFHFTPPTFESDHESAVLVVHAENPDLESVKPQTTLDEAELNRNTDNNLAETVATVAGVTLSRGSSDAAKPIIRGHHERRLLVLNDGIRHESQKWGPDHATEIDPFSAGSIRIVRGAAGTRFGPDAIGGVIIVDPPKMPIEAGSSGKLLSSFSTNGKRFYEAARVNWVPKENEQLSFRIEGNHSQGESLQTPDYVLGNTASRQWNFGTATQLTIPNGKLRLSYHHHDFKAGIFYGIKHSTPTDFNAQLEAGRPLLADLWTPSRDIDRAYQHVRHDLGSLHFNRFGSWGSFEGIYSFQRNYRLEYDQVRDSITGPQYDFTLRTHSLDTFFGHPGNLFKNLVSDGGIGFQGVFQENVYRGLPLIPNFRSFAGSLFATERFAFSSLDVELGARIDHLTRNAFLGDLDYEKHLRRGTIVDGQCEADGEVFACPHSDTTGSLSMGTLFHLKPDTLDFKLDVSNANRFPNIDELYLIGSAPTYPVYAIGSPDLGVERTTNITGTLGLRLWWLETELSAFASRFKNYVNFAPERQPDGSLHYDVTIQGTWPRYSFKAVDASTFGLDGRIDLGPEAPVGFVLNGATVRAQELGSEYQLIGTPPDSVSAEMIGRPALWHATENTELAMSIDAVRRQHLSDPQADFAPPPDGYYLIGARAETQLKLRRQTLNVGVLGYNLLNETYREYTSLIRYYADMPGRDIRVRVGVDF